MPVSCPPTNAFHVGIRVVDLEAAMADLGPALGATWCQVQERDQRVWTPEGGARQTPLRFTYSAEGPVHLELLQGQPGTIWDAGDGAGLHHSGIWSDDVKGETDAQWLAAELLTAVNGVAVQAMFDPADWPAERQQEMVQAHYCRALRA